MRVILGIGNPGSRYAFNRHNVGFIFLDYFSQLYSLSFTASKSDCFTSGGNLGSSRFLLVKPTTYVNNSGIAAQQVLSSYEIDPQNLLVVYDDINLKVGDYRVRQSGSDGGHNGLSSLIYHLNSDDFPRIRIGVGSDFEKGKMAEFVLTDFPKEEFLIIEETFKSCKILVEEFISGGVKQLLDANSRLQKPRDTDVDGKPSGE